MRFRPMVKGPLVSILLLLPIVFASCQEKKTNRQAASQKTGGCRAGSCNPGTYCDPLSGSCIPFSNRDESRASQQSGSDLTNAVAGNVGDSGQNSTTVDTSPDGPSLGRSNDEDTDSPEECACIDSLQQRCGDCQGLCPGYCLFNEQVCDFNEWDLYECSSEGGRTTATEEDDGGADNQQTCTIDCAGKSCGQNDGCGGGCGAATDPKCPGAGGQILTDFESFGNWRIGDQNNGTFLSSSEEVFSGAQAGKLGYSFPGAGNDFVVFTTFIAINGTPAKISLRLRGDGQEHLFNFWIKDTSGTVWSIPMGKVNSTDWKESSNTIAIHPWPGGLISGSGSSISFPISLHAIVLDDVPDNFSGSGAIYIDSIIAK